MAKKKRVKVPKMDETAANNLRHDRRRKRLLAQRFHRVRNV